MNDKVGKEVKGGRDVELLKGAKKMNKPKLPKQFRDWLRSAGMEIECRLPRKYRHCELYSFKGHGRQWRINCYGVFEMSVPVEDFDRWATSNSGVEFEFSLIKNKQQFKDVINEMLKRGTSTSK